MRLLSHRNLSRSTALLLALGGSAPAFADSILLDADRATLPADAKSSCLVAGQIFSGGMGHLEEVKLRTFEGKDLTTPGYNSAFSGDGFAFVNVPKGPFRISYISYQNNVAASSVGPSAFGSAKSYVHTVFGEAMPGGGFVKKGDMPNELSGTCSGGFIWLGVWKGKQAGTFSSASLSLGNDSVAASKALDPLKDSLKGTAWAAEIDHPASNTPLPEAQTIKAYVANVAPIAAPVKSKVGTQVKLVEGGAEPKRALRYAPKEGAKRAAAFSAIVASLPRMKWSLDTTVVKGSDALPARYDFVVTKGPTSNEAGITGFVQGDDHGTGVKGEHHFAAGKAPTVGPPISAVAGVANTIVPFPEEAVGVGASWQVELTAEASNYVYNQTITYKLEALDGDIAKVSMVQKAKTTFKTPLALPAGKMLGNEIQGSGSAKVNLGQLVPDSYMLANDAVTLYEGRKDSAAPAHSETAIEGK